MTEFNFDRLQGETQFRHLVRLSIAKLNKEHSMDWLELVDKFNLDYSAETLRKKSYGWKDFLENEEIEKINSEEQITYKETTEILSDGSHKSDKLVRMNAEQSKDVNYILDAHGFDKESWELVNAKNNIWNVHSKQDGVQTLYSSKVTVKPKNDNFTYEKFLETISKKVKPVTIDRIEKESDSKLLEIPLYDMHFGVSTLEYYQNHLNEIAYKIRSRSWDTILIPIGQDLLHNDNFKGQTASGTIIEKVDMEKAFNDALQFYTTVIQEALVHSKNVECIYIKGNHDESISYGFFRTLQATFPQANFESSLKQRKGFVWENIFIGMSHGDKGGSRLIENFMTDYGKLIAMADIREIHTGHLHSELSKDKFGIVQRTLSTANKTDDWHDDNGFIGANKRFQLFEYSPSSLDAIYYI